MTVFQLLSRLFSWLYFFIFLAFLLLFFKLVLCFGLVVGFFPSSLNSLSLHTVFSESAFHLLSVLHSLWLYQVASQQTRGAGQLCRSPPRGQQQLCVPAHKSKFARKLWQEYSYSSTPLLGSLASDTVNPEPREKFCSAHGDAHAGKARVSAALKPSLHASAQPAFPKGSDEEWSRPREPSAAVLPPAASSSTHLSPAATHQTC